MAERPRPARFPWRPLAAISGFTSADDLPLLLWPLLWSAGWATHGGPDASRLAALLLAVIFARAAAWSAWAPSTGGLRTIPRERRLLVALFVAASLCFALPLGWAGLLVPLALALAGLWLALRRRSYLSDPLLAAALAVVPMATWLTQRVPLSRAAGLLVLAAMLWSLAALVINPPRREGAALARLFAGQGPGVAAALQGAALASLALAGYQERMGPGFWSGLLLALVIAGLRLHPETRGRLRTVAWETLWGGCLFVGLVASWLRVP